MAEESTEGLRLIDSVRPAREKILPRARAGALCRTLRSEGRSLVFTNGCFDLLHAGHVTYLAFARAQGDALVVGLNSDESMRRAKGPSRPIHPQDERALVLGSLEMVDAVVIFDEDEPRDLIADLRPSVLVKGEDWAHFVSGRDLVEADGGRVVLAPLVPGRSTTGTLERIQSAPSTPEGEPSA